MTVGFVREGALPFSLDIFGIMTEVMLPARRPLVIGNHVLPAADADVAPFAAFDVVDEDDPLLTPVREICIGIVFCCRFDNHT